MIIDIWATPSLPACPVTIYPDGCQDVIWVHPPGARPFWKLAALDSTARVIRGDAGAAMRGFRLAPGTVIDPRLFQTLAVEDPDEAAVDTIRALVRRTDHVADMMEACRAAPAEGVAALARHLGLSLRSLQRLAQAETGQGPLFWLRLSRLRQAMTEAAKGTSLAEAASGFADQAHFTREARRFFGAPPARLLADQVAMTAILAPGL